MTQAEVRTFNEVQGLVRLLAEDPDSLTPFERLRIDRALGRRDNGDDLTPMERRVTILALKD